MEEISMLALVREDALCVFKYSIWQLDASNAARGGSYNDGSKGFMHRGDGENESLQ